MLLGSLAMLLSVTAANGDHVVSNGVYRELIEVGVVADGSPLGRLPQPFLPDGLDGPSQQRLLKELAGPDVPLERLMRASVVAPHVLRMDQQPVPGRGELVRRADFWYIAYGDLPSLASEKFLGEMISLSEENAGGMAISAAELAKRNITLSMPPGHEGFAHVTYPLMNRVELHLTGHSMWSQSADSLVTSVTLDPRFLEDAQFPNAWRPLKLGENGQPIPGEPQPYAGSGFYLKITRLAEPTGALFAEGHLVFVEPRGWFDGVNALGSKLPVLVQAQVRNSRRAMLKASPTAPTK